MQKVKGVKVTQKVKIVKRKFCIKNTHTFTIIAMNYVPEQLKMSGPITVLCGTPCFTISQSEDMPLGITFCLQLARNRNSNSFASWEKPYISIF